ncbi:nitrilase-related carbon-nitrogen hydrolase [Nesterenkonia sp. F]|uniref:nitrilase-related carbon-nitrogen hydrolase n=1 Tax=Nesterenkonia sp. F TaxID=795955 RepID=UPI000255D094|nr:nitrilase-related carbon-nitrogen hydrolase [Nesterenkonia sp. F]
MRIALLQAAAVPLDVDHDLAVVDAAAADAAARGAELLLTPELFPVGYAPARIRTELADAVIDDAAARLAAIARRHGVALVHSLPSHADPRRGITATLVDDAGAVRAVHTKTHLFGPAEQEAFSPGQARPPLVKLGGLTLGLLICYEVEFPETVRDLAVRGADVVLVPTALAGCPTVARTLVPARAVENGITVAYANHCGAEEGLVFDGESVIAGPDGAPAPRLEAGPEPAMRAGEITPARAGSEPELLVAEVGPARGRITPQQDPDGPWYLNDRRPALYRRWAEED